jgi:hypothetical protein
MYSKIAMSTKYHNLNIVVWSVVLWSDVHRTVVPGVCYVDPSGSANSPQGIRGNISVKGSFV